MMKILVLMILLTSCASHLGQSKRWYRGNTHAHTKLSGHGDATPDEVAKWYHNKGYNFLVLSEHNKFIDPKSINLPKPTRKDFILIPGVEVSGNHVVHTTAFNVTEVIPWKIKTDKARDVLQFHVDGTLKAKGTPIANHPNFAYALNADDIASVKKLSYLELYNAHPLVNNHGDHEHPGVEEMWDDLLTRGKRIYALASDDAHYFHTDDPKKSRPGFGWIMVRSHKLRSKEIIEAMDSGDFYASSGVILNDVVRGYNYQVSVNKKETASILNLNSDNFEVIIEFIGENGKVFKTVQESDASFSVKSVNSRYIRSRITVKYKGKEYHAWTMPYFKV